MRNESLPTQTDCLVTWCIHSNLVLDTLKAVAIVVDFRKNPVSFPFTLYDSPINTVEYFYSGNTSGQHHYPGSQIGAEHQHPHQGTSAEDVLPAAAKENQSAEDNEDFYTSIIKSIFTCFITIWCVAATAKDKARLQHIICYAEKVLQSSISLEPVCLQEPGACRKNCG